jgi:hypothetical protein
MDTTQFHDSNTDAIPAESVALGYVYRINKRLVAAETLEDAIKVYRSHPTNENEIIEEIRLLDKELALIEKL